MQNSMAGWLIVTDMDGTLLTTDKHISKENLEAIDRFRSEGGKFTVATGRSIPSLEHYVEELKLDTPTILYNGGAVYDYKSRKMLWHSLLNQTARAYLQDVYDRFPSVGIEILMEDCIYVVRLNDIVSKHLDTEKLAYVITTLDEVPKDGWFKALFALQPSEMDEFESYLLSKGYPDVTFVRSFTHYFEMLPEGCSKGGALKHLSAFTGVPVDHIVAIGDYYNDYEMIRKAGIGVTVENAPQDLKDIARMVVCCNDDHALADLIEKLEQMVC